MRSSRASRCSTLRARSSRSHSVPRMSPLRCRRWYPAPRPGCRPGTRFARRLETALLLAVDPHAAGPVPAGALAPDRHGLTRAVDRDLTVVAIWLLEPGRRLVR